MGLRESACAALVLALAAGSAAAQEDPAAAKKARQQAALKESLDAKLKEPWVAAGGWTADLDAARARAKAEKKIILAYFTQSFAKSERCESFEGKVLSSADFKEVAKAHVLYVHVASKLDGEKQADLPKRLGIPFLPFCVGMDAEGAMLYPFEEYTVAGLKDMLAKSAEDLALREKKTRTPAEEMRFIVLEHGAERVTGPEARKRAEALQGLDAAGALARDDFLIFLDILEELARYKKDQLAKFDPGRSAETGKIFAAMHKAGRRPKYRHQPGAFYSHMLDYAESVKDVPLFEEALECARAAMKAYPGSEMLVKMYEERLAKLKTGGGEKK
jgi:hypothetical protein